MVEITIEWSCGHDAQDWDNDPDWIARQLDAGFDEGPLLVVSRPQPNRRNPEPQIFESVATYVSHLAHYSGQLNGERWIGVVREWEPVEREDVLAAIHRLVALTAARAIPPMPSRVNRTVPNPMDLHVLKGIFQQRSRVNIDHSGDGLDEVLGFYPTLSIAVMVPHRVNSPVA